MSLTMAAVVFTDSTLTVQADTPLARPASTLPPKAPAASFLTQARPAARALLPFDALHGMATWYGAMRQGHWTASGERFDEMAMTAAHKTLPFGTVLRVVNLKTKRSVVVRVNDRGVLPGDHVIDLSYAAAEELNIVRTGVVPVRLEVLSLGKTGGGHAAAPAGVPAHSPAE
ncbi:MAG TPA: septal ring lytic transglycosylase RlpA family protein [Terracidiphilus sp.]|nr:septal ring lytic transglycosylase RlpA family protein [Terracidiphilus sp.]